MSGWYDVQHCLDVIIHTMEDLKGAWEPSTQLGQINIAVFMSEK